MIPLYHGGPRGVYEYMRECNGE
ncbi:hypothetical protein E2C01_099811 [Portunus trituberculatus]|uniref:Uncharacterized protein n=1 Tax=Portunus trituberculatus TaxID=210409 RepID=A0A5B7KFT6_PORTR|nr:hypothetical protein [Portunus trituberculatus]